MSTHGANRRSLRFGLSLLAAALTIGLTQLAGAANPQSVSFAREVKPLLARRCFACHGPTKGEGGLHLDDPGKALAELDSGSHAIVPGSVEESVLVDRVSAEDEEMRMPPEGKPLDPAEIDLLRRWIAQGAKWEKHWAFVPPKRIEPLPATRVEWNRNAIDKFILAKLDAAGLEPAPPADKRTLARRAYFDLTGLPPTNEELQAFLDDDSPHAWERLIDRLLASPHYGEHWARHWLDVVRYAETNSFERDTPKPNAWKYRDYVIRSLNDDKPYDQFLREQLAGDELDKVTDESIIATGYYRLGLWDDEPADPLQARFDELDDLVSTTSQAMLGLTVGCARCHDHKIDPIPQADYYGMVAFFGDVTPYADVNARDPGQYSQWDMSPQADRDARAALGAAHQFFEHHRVEMEQAGIRRMSATDQRRTEGPDRDAVLSEKLEGVLTPIEWTAYRAMQASAAAMQTQLDLMNPPNAALSLAHCNPQPEATHILGRGNPHVPGDAVEPHFPQLFGDATPPIPPADPSAHSAGRRHVLADWVASPANMLTARVIANRVWQHHFGRGIVRTPNNFGELGAPPTHPELLDWLALWLSDHDWKLKSLHRLIMTSQAYQMSSAGNEQALAADPTNDLFWRFDMRRLSAEEIRDATLVATGRFNPQMYGPSFYEKLGAEVLATQSRPGDGWGESSEQDRCRRSIYIHVKRSLLTPLLTAFDFPDVDTSCEARFNTTQPGQALAMLNGAFMNEEAGKLADRVINAKVGAAHDQVAETVRLALNRPASAEEIAEGSRLLENLTQEHGLEPREALRYWCLAILNLNEFIYLD